MVNKTAWPHQEAIKTVLRIQLFDSIKQTTDDIVSTGSLTSGENNTDINSLGVVFLTRHELYQRHTIGVREQLFDFFLIVNTLCGSTLYNLYCTLKSLRQLWLISSSFFLQCTNFHNFVSFIYFRITNFRL